MVMQPMAPVLKAYVQGMIRRNDVQWKLVQEEYPRNGDFQQTGMEQFGSCDI